MVRGGPRPHVGSPNVGGITPLTSGSNLPAPGPRGPPSRPMMKQTRPNIVHQINQHRPVASHPYLSYMNQYQHIQESSSCASSGSYYQQAVQFDVVQMLMILMIFMMMSRRMSSPSYLREYILKEFQSKQVIMMMMMT